MDKVTCIVSFYLCLQIAAGTTSRLPRANCSMFVLISARGRIILRTMDTITTIRIHRINMDSTAMSSIRWFRVAFISESGSVAMASQLVVWLFLNMDV